MSEDLSPASRAALLRGLKATRMLCLVDDLSVEGHVFIELRKRGYAYMDFWGRCKLTDAGRCKAREIREEMG